MHQVLGYEYGYFAYYAKLNMQYPYHSEPIFM